MPNNTYNVLEVFLSGALAHRGTLWLRENELNPILSENVPVLPDPLVGAQRVEFLDNYGGESIFLGRGFHPLAPFLDRTRLVAMNGGIGVHEIGWAEGFTGEGIGRPQAKSIGARIAAAHLGQNPALPQSWFLDGVRAQLLTQAATAAGGLPSQARPVVLPVGTPNLLQHLERSATTHTDPLVDLYRDRYSARLTHPGEVAPLRSADFEAYSNGLDRMHAWSDLHGALDGLYVETAVAPNLYASNPVTKSVELAARLIGLAGVRHVSTVLSGSILPGTLDTHGGFEANAVGHIKHHNAVMWGICNALRTAIDDGILDLDTTVVVLHSEFGRYDDGVNGSEHWTDGYLSMLLGGPTVPGLAGDFTVDSQGGQANGYTRSEFADAIALVGGAEIDTCHVSPGAENGLLTDIFGQLP